MNQRVFLEPSPGFLSVLFSPRCSMDSSKRPSLIALPLIAIALLTAGMTQRASAAHASSVKSAMTGVSAIDQLLDRVANRAAYRQRDVDNDNDDDNDADEIDTPVLRRRVSAPASSRSSSSRARSVSSVRPAAPAENAGDVAQEVFRLVNAERAKAGLPAYTYNNTLEQSAEDYSEHMRSTNCFSHTACGSTLKERMHASGYYKNNGRSYSYGENIARGQDSAAEVMEDWMNSPSHKGAILSTKFKEIGIGRSGNYWTQHFGAVR